MVFATFLDETLCDMVFYISEVYLLIFHFLKKLILSSAFPGGSSRQHFIQNDSHGEDVSFVGIMISGQGLQRHVKGSSYVDSVFELEPSLDSKAKICNFPFISDSENVSRLEVTMDDSFLNKILVSWEDLLHDLNCHTLSDFLFLIYVIHQVSMCAVLQDDVIMMGSLDYFVAFYDVVVAEGFVNLYFALEHVEVWASELF